MPGTLKRTAAPAFVRHARHPLLALFLASLLALPAGAQEVPDAAPVVQAITDQGRCEADLPVPGDDRCESWAVRRPRTMTGHTVAMALSPVNGTVFTTGTTVDETIPGVYEDQTPTAQTTAQDPETGEVLWSAIAEGPVGYTVPAGVAVSPDGSRVFMAGWTYLGGYQSNFLIQALDASTGSVAWEATYDGAAHILDYVRDVTVSGSRVVVTGRTFTADGSSDAMTIAYDGATGERLWEAQFDGEAHKRDGGEAVTTSPDGSLVLVAGSREIGPGTESVYLTIAYDIVTGEEVWQAGFQGPELGWDGAHDIAASHDAVFVTGRITDREPNGREWGTVAYDIHTGEQLWSSTYLVGLGGWSTPSAIAVAPDGSRVFITGLSDNGALSAQGQSRDYTTASYDAATGEQLWMAHYDGPARGRDQAYALAVTPDGASVIVTGQTDTGPRETAPSGPAWDFATISYEAASGAQQWLARYNGSASQKDVAWDLAISPSGDAVFVTGTGLGPPRGPSPGEVLFETVSYDLQS